MLGGIGCCGRSLCCATFLGDFEPVSIRMAKEQNLSLNPAKISGICGRLMCCLKYESNLYAGPACRKQSAPKPGARVIAPDGEGNVIAVDPARNTVSVKRSDGSVSQLPIAEVAEKEDDGSA